MINQGTPLESTIQDDIFGVASYELPSVVSKKFLPWHKPRKQFVRNRQWKHEIEMLLDTFGGSIEGLRYLGLPGTDLLDLRYFHNEICQPRQIPLFFLGFNDDAKPNGRSRDDLNISLAEVRSLNFVEQSSDILGDNYKNIAEDSSNALEKARAFGPYDIINLDLCDGFTLDPPNILEQSHYNAVNQLLAIQSQRKDPWLFFLTTRVGRNQVHKDVLSLLCTKYTENLEGCSEFKNISDECFRVSNGEDLQNAILQDEGMANIVLTALCKWLLGSALDHRPQVLMEVRGLHGYQVYKGNSSNDLFSIAIKFVPTVVPVPDRLKLASITKPLVSECSKAPYVVRAIHNRQDVDKLLETDTDLHEKMVSEMSILLKLARYNVSDYVDWVAAGCPKQY